MVRPNNRYRRIEYDYLVAMQGGEYCKICNYRPQIPYSLHIDHIVEGLAEPEYNAPRNKQLLCEDDNGIKELQRRKNVRDGVKFPGEGSRNLESASEPVFSHASPQLETPAIEIMRGEDRKETNTSAEAKNEANEPWVENFIKANWNRDGGIVYSRCVYEITRLLREATGSGSPAAVKRYIGVLCSDGGAWRIDPKTKRICPATHTFYDPTEALTKEEVSANFLRITEAQRKKIAELEDQLKATNPMQAALPTIENGNRHAKAPGEVGAA